MTSDEVSVVRFIGGRKFAAVVLYMLLTFALALAEKLTPLWAGSAGAAVAAFIGANLWLETRTLPKE